jgi:predicted small metal-binding protein
MAKACGKTMTAVFASGEEEMMKKIAEKAKKALTASPLCQDLPDELKEHVVEACERCLRQISIAEADSR